MHAGPRWSTLANIARHPRRSSPLAIDTEMYKWRHLIESFFCKLKEFKRIALRAGKTDQSFAAMIYLAAAVINSRAIPTGLSTVLAHSAQESSREVSGFVQDCLQKSVQFVNRTVSTRSVQDFVAV